MKNGTTRRAFAASTLAVAAGARLPAAEKEKIITSASVPDDPDAPEVQEGTQPQFPPFGEIIEFHRQPIVPKLAPFKMTEVRLLPGPFEDAQSANSNWIHSLPADRLVYGFRINAGLPSQAQPLGGWEKPDCELRGHFVGHYLSACALLHSSTGDKEVLARGNEIVAQLAVCQSRLNGGYLSAFPLELFDRLNARKPVWAPFYTVHKIMAGMLDMYQLTGNRQALEVLTGMAAWTNTWTANIPEPHMQMILDTEYGGMNEVLYNLAAVTGEDRFAVVGDRFTKKRFFNPLALHCDQLRGLHANTHIPQVIGAARRYEISGDERFADVADYFWSEVTQSRAYTTGGTSNNEGWLVQPNRLAAELSLGADTTECCCAYNMLKLTRHLYTWNADPRYFDYYERVLYNHRLGTIDPQTGTTQYYLGIVPGSWRTYGTPLASFWCCNGTGVEEYSKLNNSIYFHSAAGVYVNLFIPSELHWQEKGIHLRQETTFPEEPATRLTFQLDQPASFSLHLRVPAWVASYPAVKINGQNSEISAAPGSYLVLDRVWKSGDIVEMSLPMELRVETMPDDRSLAAVCYGPLVLAGQVGELPDSVLGLMGPNFKKYPAPALPGLRVAADSPSKTIQAAGQPLAFQTSGIRLAPFYRLSGQRYSIYWRIS